MENWKESYRVNVARKSKDKGKTLMRHFFKVETDNHQVVADLADRYRAPDYEVTAVSVRTATQPISTQPALPIK